MPDNTKPLLLLVTRNMPPLVGGMEKLMQHTALALSDSYQVHVIAPKGCRNHLPKHISVQETHTALPLFLIQSLLYTLLYNIKSKPAIVFGGSGLIAPCLTLTKFFFKRKTACYVHGLDIIVDNALYQRLFTPCLKHQDLIITNSKSSLQLARNAKVPRKKLIIVHPGCDVHQPLNKKQCREIFDQRHATENKPLLLFVGRMTPRKGLKAFIEKAFESLLQNNPDYTLCIVGDTPTDSLTRPSSEKEQIKKMIEQKNWKENILFLGKVEDRHLQEAYAAADCLIFPLIHQPGDVEGFGMVAIEAAAQGTPSIAFDIGGISDAIHHMKSGILVEADHYHQLNHSICNLYSLINNAEEKCYEHAQKYSWKHYQTNLLTTLSSIHTPL